MFTAALFILAKTWKQPKCPSTQDWIKKMWYYIDITIIYSNIYIYYSAKKGWNNALCSNMDGPRGYHTKWNYSDSERPTSYDTSYLWIYLKKDTNELIYKTETLPDFKNKLMVTKGERWGVGDRLGIWDWHMHTEVLWNDWPMGTCFKAQRILPIMW